jgi:hypothetical protein
LIYLRARFYDPSTGQFISRDPATTTTRQPYQYVQDSPLIRTDPSGLWAIGFGYGITGFVGIGSWGIGFTASWQVAYTSDRSISVIGNAGGGAGTGVAGGAFGGVGFNGFFSRDARSLNDLLGPFDTVDLAAGWKNAGEIQASSGATANELGIAAPFVPCGIGAGIGALHVQTTTSKLWTHGV